MIIEVKKSFDGIDIIVRYQYIGKGSVQSLHIPAKLIDDLIQKLQEARK